MQVPLEHTGVDPGNVGHTCPHEPQLRTSLEKFTQPPPHDGIEGERHAVTHVPPLHKGVAVAQECPQSPQFEALVPRFVSQPSVAIMLQSAKPPEHEPTEQAPPWHRPTPLAMRHGR